MISHVQWMNDKVDGFLDLHGQAQSNHWSFSTLSVNM